ncbi:MAG: 23S rRNA (adenine(2503)-C(2))-methyltransferase RlmN [Parcubacteria group bacterium]|jgi:23S rRNA (adenine(2503)-C(2))-methyltransferase
MNPEKLEKILKNNNQPSFRLKQIQKAIYQDGVLDFAEITTIPKELREILRKELSILSFSLDKILVSDDKRSIKALLKLKDNNLIETVLISPKPGDWSACISSQVGCPLGCGFCATGRNGFKRNLTAEEITDQVLFWKQYIKNNFKFQISNFKFSVVYMGMGEPFLNWEEVSKSLKNLISPDLFGFGSRSISVSTAGIPEDIEKLAEEFPQINLAISLHFATDEQRDKFMPINKKHNLSELRNSLRNYFKTSNRKVFIEYIMLENINDSKEDADNLIKYLKSIGKLQLLHVNLIRYNSADKRFDLSRPKRPEKVEPLMPSNSGVTREFKDYLVRNGVSATIRKSLGEDIQGACGQLAGKKI